MNKKRLCKNCLKTMVDDYPSTLMGGIVGTALAFLTGAIVCIPVSLFGGLLVDASCSQCGKDDQEMFEIIRDKKNLSESEKYINRDIRKPPEQKTEIVGEEFTVIQDFSDGPSFDFDAGGFGEGGGD